VTQPRRPHDLATENIQLRHRAPIWADSRVVAGIRFALAGGILAVWHPEKRLKNCCMKPWRSRYD
jgi:hypothetical protein